MMNPAVFVRSCDALAGGGQRCVGGFGGDERRSPCFRSRALLPPAAALFLVCMRPRPVSEFVGRSPSTSADSSERSTREPLCWHVRATCSSPSNRKRSIIAKGQRTYPVKLSFISQFPFSCSPEKANFSLRHVSIDQMRRCVHACIAVASISSGIPLVGRIGGQLATATRYQQRQVFTAAARAPQPPGDAGLALGRLGTWRERSGSRARASAGGGMRVPCLAGRRCCYSFFYLPVIRNQSVKSQRSEPSGRGKSLQSSGWLLGRSSSPPATRRKRTPDAALEPPINRPQSVLQSWPIPSNQPSGLVSAVRRW